MTKKDYVAIARILSDTFVFTEPGLSPAEHAAYLAGRKNAIDAIARAFANVAAADNGRFDRGRFFRAAGIEL